MMHVVRRHRTLQDFDTINIKDLTEQQTQALLDLAMLAMYADGHLASAEDERIHRLLTAMGFATDYDCSKHYDASIGRISRHSQTAAAARTHTATLAQSFTTRDQRRRVLDVLDDLTSSDRSVAPQESSYLAIVREVFQR
ncbi:MAG TPA: TerB family tellurite resistance protein [Candidatus Paceibacterota bacterium]|nr:TerB family tellurite resistance protein [Candidatus Paceibacterota bacterium]